MEHFNSSTKRKTSCYVENLLKRLEYEMIALPNWDYILVRGSEIIELTVKKWERRIMKMLEIVTDPDDHIRIKGLLGNVRELIYYERLPGLLVHVFSNKGNLNELEKLLLIESKKYLSIQAKIKSQIRILKKLSVNKKRKLDEKGKRLIDLIENTIEAFRYMKSPFFVGLDQWYSKYGKKVIDQKNREWKKKLSEGWGSYPNQYSGIL